MIKWKKEKQERNEKERVGGKEMNDKLKEGKKGRKKKREEWEKKKGIIIWKKEKEEKRLKLNSERKRKK